MQVFAQEEAEAGRFRKLLDKTYQLAKQTAILQGLTDGALRPWHSSGKVVTEPHVPRIQHDFVSTAA